MPHRRGRRTIDAESVSAAHARTTGRIAVGLIFIGVLPRLSGYLTGRALWFDEAALCVNVLDRSFGGLSAPLDFKQVAPVLYLWILKLCTAVFGSTVYAVRFPSIIASLAALWLFWVIARRLLSVSGSVIALALAVLSQHLITYAGEAKPYALDVMAGLLVLYLALRWAEEPATWKRSAGVGGIFALLVWCSFPVVFVIAGTGLVQLSRALFQKNTGSLRHLTVLYSIAAASFLAQLGLVVLPNRANSDTMEFMNLYWRHGFMPFPPTSHWDIRWYRDRTFLFFDMPGGFTLQGLALACWLMGLISLGVRRPWHAMALVLPLVLTLAASNLKLYPFHGRMTLFLAPLIFLLVGEGIGWLLETGKGRARYAVTVVLITLLMTQPLVRAARMVMAPTRHHELGAVLDHVQANWQPGDRIYLRLGDYLSYRFLAHRYDFGGDDLQFEATDGSMGATEAEFLTHLEAHLAVRGRVWFPMAYDQQETVAPYVAFLEERGQRFEQYDARGASVHGFLFANEKAP